MANKVDVEGCHVDWADVDGVRFRLADMEVVHGSLASYNLHFRPRGGCSCYSGIKYDRVCLLPWITMSFSMFMSFSMLMSFFMLMSFSKSMTVYICLFMYVHGRLCLFLSDMLYVHVVYYCLLLYSCLIRDVFDILCMVGMFSRFYLECS
jgi:hypothetical protein